MVTRLIMVISQNIHSYVESLCYAPETSTALYLNYTLTKKIQNSKKEFTNKHK